MTKKALITGITGQDGSYLAEFLLNKNYEVYGMHRRTSLDVFKRIGHIKKDLNLVSGDLIDLSSLIKLVKKIMPNEFYNLGAQSFVPASWNEPISTAEVTGLGSMKCLEAIKIVDPKIKFYQASSSEMFGQVKESPQTEKTPFHPRSPYGLSKVFSYWATVNYRESYKMHASNGILFNHESPRRGKQFVTKKISHSVVKIKKGLQNFFELGNLNAKRDWGFAGDYVEAMWLMMQQEIPKDYLIATGETHSVREFVEEAFNLVNMPISWIGEGINEVGEHKGKALVKINPKFYRPADVDILLGNPIKAKRDLGWVPKTDFKGLVKMMVESDLKNISKKV